MAAGIFSLEVWQRPKVVIIPTGTELIHHGDIKTQGPVKKNQIIEYNSLILAGLVRECHGIPIIYDIVSDLEGKIQDALNRAIDSDADMVIINAGSSAGSKDYTANVIGEMGEAWPSCWKYNYRRKVFGLPSSLVASMTSSCLG